MREQFAADAATLKLRTNMRMACQVDILYRLNPHHLDQSVIRSLHAKIESKLPAIAANS